MSDFINTIDVLGDEAVIDSIIDRSITEFKDDTLTSVGKYAFYGCTALALLDLPNCTSIDQYAMYNAGSSTDGLELNLPNLTSIGQVCCRNANITTLYLPKISSLPLQVFYGCMNLTKAILPICTSFSNNAFGHAKYNTNSSLQWLDILGGGAISGNSFNQAAYPVPLNTFIIRNDTTVSTLSTLLASTAIAKGTGYIYVPSALLADYKAATNWSTYADQFRALEDYTVDGTTTGELDETKI